MEERGPEGSIVLPDWKISWRMKVEPGVDVVGHRFQGVLRYRGAIIWQCPHKHTDEAKALDCADNVLVCEPGSALDKKMKKAIDELRA